MAFFLMKVGKSQKKIFLKYESLLCELQVLQTRHMLFHDTQAVHMQTIAEEILPIQTTLSVVAPEQTMQVSS